MPEVPHEVVEHVSWLIYARGRELRSRRRRLSCFQQALLVLVHLRKNETLQQVGAGFGVSTATAGRYVTEAVDLSWPTTRPPCWTWCKAMTRTSPSSWTAP
ncbi:helix-turn-helix domain-containing protein [Streptomyces acidicola]|uniref:helix-turn-helix domain-containing protein n=1 Tax=Streptomyces acidicola TaxID=2596892 RepID=UPI003807FD0E